jgi:diguanylate cyclase (GGDEF)-like protein
MRGRFRLSLTQKFALISLVPVVALGVALDLVLQHQLVDRTLQDASESAQLIARLAIQPRLTPRELRVGLDQAAVKVLDHQLEARSTTQDLARIKIWNNRDEVIYSDDHALMGRRLTPSDDLEQALEGHPDAAEVVTPSLHTETASEVGLGRLVEVYVPLRFSRARRPAGAFEIYLSYKPLAAALSKDKRMIAVVLFLGLALLWAALFRIVAGASGRLRRQADENDRLARYDQLTGLPNRTLFMERTARALLDHECVAVLLLDVDGFKEINDTLGHRVGDIVLCEVACRLQRSLGSGALVARLGADEYAILSFEVTGEAQALQIAAAVQRVLDPPVEVEGVALNVDLSAGVALAPRHAADVDTLVQRADVALDRARSHRSRVELYSAEYDNFDAGKLALLGQVRPALEQHEFVLLYQPKQALGSGLITGVEALLRWEHPELGLLLPTDFIGMVEQTSLVGPVSLYVIDVALEQINRWREHGIELEMSANLSARNLLDQGLAGQIERLLRRHEVPSDMLTIEVTESAAMADPERAVAVLEELRELGVGVSIDDFGSGNASIAYLTRLPANELKIDRSFVTDIAENPRDEAIVRSTIELARHLGLRVVAEGIETEAALHLLSELGCDTGQGYLISRPLGAEALSAWLAADGEGGPSRHRRPAQPAGARS